MHSLTVDGNGSQQRIEEEPITDDLLRGVILKSRYANVLYSDIILPLFRVAECRARLEANGFVMSGSLQLQSPSRQFQTYAKFRNILNRTSAPELAVESPRIVKSNFENKAIADNFAEMQKRLKP